MKGNNFMFLRDIPRGKQIKGILWNLTSIESNKILYIQSNKTKEDIRLILPQIIPLSLAKLLFNTKQDDLNKSVLNKEITILRGIDDSIKIHWEQS